MKNKLNNESILLKGLIKGDHDCFRRIFEHYSKPLYWFSMSYLKENQMAEDVVQEVFIKIWDKRKDIDLSKSFHAFIVTIAMNFIRKHFNRNARLNLLKHDIISSLYDDPVELDEVHDFEETLMNLDVLIQLMPDRRKEIFIGRKFKGKSHKELAEEFGIKPKTVEYHISEAMKFLKSGFNRHPRFIDHL